MRFGEAVSCSYEVAPIFLIRMAGVPFETLENLATQEVAQLARELINEQRNFQNAIAEAQRFFDSGEHLLERDAFRVLRSAVRAQRAPAAMPTPQPAVFSDYAAAAERVARAEAELQTALERAVESRRRLLVEAARRYLPRQLIFNSGGVSELLHDLMAPPAEPKPRNTRTRERERHLLLYLQRVAGKNDSFSEFGPTSWGHVDAAVRGVTFAPSPEITARETFLERWTAHAIAAAMNEDPDVFAEVTPRIAPNVRRVNGTAMLADTGALMQLDAEEMLALDACHAGKPAHAFPDPEVLRALHTSGLVRCEVEVPALDPHAFAALRDDVLAWREGLVRDRWLEVLQPLAALAEQFAATTETRARQELLGEARSRFQSLGIERKLGERHLYSAVNPIGEECFRQSDFKINQQLINEVADEAAPWINLWRDSYAFIASRVAAGLRSVLEKVPGSGGAVPLPMFLRACESAKLPLTGPGLVVFAHMAFQEVKAAFRTIMQPHKHLAEYELTTADCAFVREKFDYPKFDAYTYPSADLQLSARSMDAVGRGEYQWILAELHPPAALLHHGAYWSCPDKPLLNSAFVQTIDGLPSMHFGFFAADFTAHTAVRLFDALGGFCNFVAPQRGNPAWRTVAPADAEVFADEATGDVAVRKAGTHEYLGSFARAWLIPLGFHPFSFGMAPHMPRLRCGNVIVQRRAWTVTLEELAPGDYAAISRHLVVAIERLRAAKHWPRYIYIRPTEQALRRSGVEGRDKDTKPVFVDLESYLCLEMFHHWLVKAGELEVTEMLPDPEHLCWQEKDGRRTFELRTLIVPRS